MRAVLLFVVALVLVPSVAAAPARTTTLPSFEQALLKEINATRATYGLSQFSLSPALQSAARAHSAAMLERGFFDHRSPDGTSMPDRVKKHYRTAGYARWSVGENLLAAPFEIDAREVVRLWLQSPGHRHNLLARKFRQVGIAADRSSTAPGYFHGQQAVVITLDFGTRTRAR
jgi:uncharacterized protein YkwD